jgi:hypothetical protein
MELIPLQVLDFAVFYVLNILASIDTGLFT